MAITNRILLKKSSVVGKIPKADDLEHGELALNFSDGRLYFKNSNDIVDFFENGKANNLLPFLASNEADFGLVSVGFTEFSFDLGNLGGSKSIGYQFGDVTEATSPDGIDGGTF